MHDDGQTYLDLGDVEAPEEDRLRFLEAAEIERMKRQIAELKEERLRERTTD